MPTDTARLRALGEEIVEAERLLTPGPWMAGIDGNDRMYGPDGTEHAGPIMIRGGNKHGLVRLRNAVKEAVNSYEGLLEELERLRAALEWRPIATAPKDGTPVDLWVKVKTVIGDHHYRDEDCWWDTEKGKWKHGDFFVSGTPTHWRPVPAGPQEAADRTR